MECQTRSGTHAWSSFHALVAGDTVVAQQLSHSETDTDQSCLAFVDVRQVKSTRARNLQIVDLHDHLR
jgi:hypothetical protein